MDKSSCRISLENQSMQSFVLELQAQAAKRGYEFHVENQSPDRLVVGMKLPDWQGNL